MKQKGPGRPAAEGAAASAVYSMTGFAEVGGTAGEQPAWKLTLKSVNHRFLDLYFRMPGGTDRLEMRLRGLLKTQIKRGHLEVTLTSHHASRGPAVFDREALKGYIEAFRAAAAEYGFAQQPDLNAILRLPGVVDGEGKAAEDEAGELEDQVMSQVGSLVASLNAMRAQEGLALARELTAAMGRLRGAVSEAADLRRDVEQACFDRLRQRISSLVEGAFSKDRILEEAALAAEHSDVEEEIARLGAHIDHFLSILASGGEVGKRLDFLLQEMNREANTLLSKTSGLAGSAERLTELGLGMKAEIEKAREQVQNLE